MVLYTLGQKALHANEKKAALDYFAKANSAFSPSSPYQKYSSKLVEQLKKELQ
jgi:hypothetical protein